jgi:hypothetical protein
MSVAQSPYMRVHSPSAQSQPSGARKHPDQHPVNLTRSRDSPSNLVQIVTHLTCIQDIPVYSLEENTITTEVVRNFLSSSVQISEYDLKICQARLLPEESG